ncbi:hypothetical protein JCM17380_19200 [Desulfosporosinus burensis]
MSITWILFTKENDLSELLTKLREKQAAETSWKQDVSNRQLRQGRLPPSLVPATLGHPWPADANCRELVGADGFER